MIDDKEQLPAGSFFADQRAAREAVALVLPMIEQGLAQRTIGDSGFLYIVVMDPALDPGTSDFDHAVLYEHAVGDRSAWDADYARFARDKTRVAWRTGRDGHFVRQLAPHLLTASDTGLWGSACVDGIVVGVSGGQPWFDEAIAACIAHCLKAMAKQRAASVPEAPSLGHDRAIP
ncbi:MAG TPA: hypothetical protein VNS29_05210 [Burkholderiaceae bacterium]|nr:hypothetical protein [Burkholderiaceae bacterium]